METFIYVGVRIKMKAFATTENAINDDILGII